VNIKNTSFIDNSAALGGGAIYWNGDAKKLVISPDVKYKNNSALYGPEISSNPFSMYSSFHR
jgi:predicted outer membrane repeat protein